MTGPSRWSGGVLRLLGYARKRWRGWTLILGVTLLSTAFSLAEPWPLKVLVDNVLGHRPVPAALRSVIGTGRHVLLAAVVVATLVIFGIASTLDVVLTRLWIVVGQGMVFDLTRDLFDRLLRRSTVFHSRNRVGDSMARVTDDSWAVHDVVDTLLFSPLHGILMTAGMVVLLWRMDTGLTLVSLAAAPATTAISAALARPMRAASWERRRAQTGMEAHVQQTLSGIPVVQAFNQEGRHQSVFTEYANLVIRAQKRTVLAKNLNSLGTGFVTAAGAGLVLFLGARDVISGRLTVGGLLVFVSYVASLQSQMKVFTNAYATLEGSRASITRVMEVLDSLPEVVELPGAPDLPPVRGEVRLQGVTFGYEPGRPVLEDVSLEAHPGQTVAIVGATGAGKSTLVGLVPRLFDPWEGSVSIDGYDLRDVSLASVRSQVSIVLQESFLFPISVTDNIAYGRPGATREAIEEAARAANAHDFIERLPQGYDTVVGERGATLSGGERQRMAIARALLKDAPILVLDEPTSALDAETEQLLLEALERLTRGRTTLIIAHRLSTIRGADHIVVVDAGRIVEAGTHAKLMAANGAYARLQRLQLTRPTKGRSTSRAAQ